MDLNTILDSKEQRVNIQRNLIKKYKCSLICFTLNIPGPKKDSTLYRRIHGEGVKVLLEHLSKKNIHIMGLYSFNRATGPESYICVQWETKSLKSLTVEIEEKHELGRIWDMDILNDKNQNINREIIGASSRKCMLCDGDVHVCRRSNKHSYCDLIHFIKHTSYLYFKKSYKN